MFVAANFDPFSEPAVDRGSSKTAPGRWIGGER